MGKTIADFLLPCQRRIFVTFQVISDWARFDSCFYIGLLLFAFDYWIKPLSDVFHRFKNDCFFVLLSKRKKRNTLAFLLKAIASFKVIIPFIEYEVINRNSRKTRACTSRHVEIQDKVFWRSSLFNSFHSFWQSFPAPKHRPCFRNPSISPDTPFFRQWNAQPEFLLLRSTSTFFFSQKRDLTFTKLS